MTNNVMFIIAMLGISCFCGIVPLGFAAILFFTAHKRGQVSSGLRAAKKMSVVALKPGPGLVRLQGCIAPLENPIDGSTENGVAYLRLKVEAYESDGDSSGWRGFADKTRSIPFRLDDGTGTLWINPDGLDKQLLDEGFIPDDHQIQAACILLGISPKILRGQLRFRMWEFRVGQTITVVGCVTSSASGPAIVYSKGQPFVVSPLLGDAIGFSVASQTKRAQIWALVIGIPGLIFLLCGLIGAVVMLIRVLAGL